jgi:hypothetical protein
MRVCSCVLGMHVRLPMIVGVNHVTGCEMMFMRVQIHWDQPSQPACVAAAAAVVAVLMCASHHVGDS